MKAPWLRREKARPIISARLFLMLCAVGVAAIVLFEAGEAWLPSAEAPLRLTADAPADRLPPAIEMIEEDRLSINDATVEALQRASGIGPALAQAIVDAREEMGGFYFWEELMDVPGIGQKRLDALAEYFYCPQD